MIAAVQLPLWTLPAAALVVIGVLLLIDAWIHRPMGADTRQRGPEALYDEVWDEVSVGGDSVAPSSSVSRGLTAVTTGATSDTPRVTVYARTGERSDAA